MSWSRSAATRAHAVPVDPVAPCDEEPAAARRSAPAHRRSAAADRNAREIDHRERRRRTPRTGPGLGASRASVGVRIDPDAGCEQREFDDQRRRQRVPYAETDLRASRPRRQVRPMRDDVERTSATSRATASHAGTDASPCARRRRSTAKSRRPAEVRGQAVRIRIPDEIERHHLGDARDDPHALDAEQHQHRPEAVGPLRGEHVVPSDAPGATRFAASATPKWPMNMRRTDVSSHTRRRSR